MKLYTRMYLYSISSVNIYHIYHTFIILFYLPLRTGYFVISYEYVSSDNSILALLN